MKQIIKHICFKVEGEKKDLLDVFIKKQGFSLDLVVKIIFRRFFLR